MAANARVRFLPQQDFQKHAKTGHCINVFGNYAEKS
jgi:hypothetical protein